MVLTTEPGPRERILNASLELFVDRGYFNTNIPDISKKSRCSVGSIYHHFLNKEEIAEQLYSDGIAKFRHALIEVIDLSNTTEQIIRNVIVTFLYFCEQNKMLAKYLWLARHHEFLSDKVSKPTTVGFDPFGRLLTKVIKNAIRKHEIAPLRAEVIWTLIFGISLSYILDWLDGNVRRTPTETAPILAQASWAGLCAAYHQ